MGDLENSAIRVGCETFTPAPSANTNVYWALIHKAEQTNMIPKDNMDPAATAQDVCQILRDSRHWAWMCSRPHSLPSA